MAEKDYLLIHHKSALYFGYFGAIISGIMLTLILLFAAPKLGFFNKNILGFGGMCLFVLLFGIYYVKKYRKLIKEHLANSENKK